MGYGKQIGVHRMVSGRSAGSRRGIPLEKLLIARPRSIPGPSTTRGVQEVRRTNGVGIKAVNALSTQFDIQSFREGETRRIEYACGEPKSVDKKNKSTKEENGTLITFFPMERCSKVSLQE